MARQKLHSSVAPTSESPKAKLSLENLKKAGKILRYLKPYKSKFFIALLILSVGSLLSLLFPHLVGKLTDAANGKELAPIYGDLTQIAIILIGVFLIQAIFSYFRVYLFVWVGEHVLADVRRDTYKKIISLPMKFFAENRVGELHSRVNLDLSYIQDTITSTTAELIRQFIVIIGGLAFLFTTTSVKLTSIMLAIFPILIIFAIVFGKYIRKIAKVAQEKMADANVVLEESLHSIQNVKTFTNEWFEYNRFDKNLIEVVKYGVKGGVYRGLFTSFVLFIVFGSIISVIYVGFNMVQTGEISLGDLISFVTFSLMVGFSMGSMSGLIANFQRAIGATERIFEIINETPEDVKLERIEVAANNKFHGSIKISNLNFAYPSRPEMQIFKSLNLQIEQGKSLAIVGPSGAGKSTLAALLLRLYDPLSGKIEIDGRDHLSFPLSEYRSQMAVVPQEVMLFGGTIFDNIAYGKPGASEDEIIHAAKQANAHDFIISFPEGYQTMVGERGIKLSGGQKQRVAIARAVLKNPAILILDEATSSLDSASENIVQEALNKLMKNRTTLVIAHRLSTVRNADHIAFISQGELKEYGTHDELMAIENGLFRNFKELQSESVINLQSNDGI